MTASHGPQSLLSQVRRAFYVIVWVMVALLMFQLYKAAAFIQHEVAREQQIAQQALHAWLVSELKQLEYLRRGLKTYKRALARYLENGRTPAVVAALQQMHKEFELAHVVFLSEEGDAWADKGASNLSFPHIPILDKLPENRPRLWQLAAPYKLPFWQQVLSEPGLYGVIKIPVDYDIGDRAGTLIVFKQLLKPGQSAAFLTSCCAAGKPIIFSSHRHSFPIIPRLT